MPAPTVESFDWSNHVPVDRAVLCFIIDKQQLLLIHKLRGLGKGKVNGPGGRLETGETPFDAAVRETQEEVGLTPAELRHAGELSFVFTDGYSLDCSVITAGAFTGTPVNTEEADPFWCSLDQIPFHHMWEDDRLWIPLMLERTNFRGRFIFAGDTMLDYHLLTASDAALNDMDLARK